MLDFFKQKFPRRRFVAHAIVCPEGGSCGDDPEDPVGKYHTLVRKTGGVLGSINTFKPTTPTAAQTAQQTATMAAIFRSVVNGAGFELHKRPITPSVRVATSATVGVCNNADIPRDVENGWDLDPISGKVSFNGACVPQAGSIAVVSYQSWVRNGTLLHNQSQSVVSTPAPQPPDAGVMDGGAMDAGAMDAGAMDAGAMDAGAPDAGAPDAGLDDDGGLIVLPPDAGCDDGGAC